ncbi:hypothetical protein GIB67_022468 [Kingdonia uniflora]|uniref:Uncharacterized protein n=1 Tax=Kingdonia uniflora TaxID=39325 RepID=A0A7J7MUM9_9MAGN|nr:hypothetical protein GIB67_022468 [Kingdonia uniflora]
MLKRRFYKQDHGDKDNVSDSSSSSSDSDSEVESQEEIQASEEEELTTETLSEPIRPYVSSSSNSSAARYDSGDSSENEVDFEPSEKKILCKRDGVRVILLACCHTLYYMPFFSILVSVVVEVERLVRNFLWRNKEDSLTYIRVKWDLVLHTKTAGGLGCYKIKTVDRDLRGK